MGRPLLRHFTLAEAAFAQRLPRPRVLLVEHDEDLRRILSVRLRRLGFEVDRVLEAREATARLAEHAFDLLIVDLGERAGEELALLRSETPSIVMLPPAQRAVFEQARQLGAYAVFERLFELDDLITAALNVAPRE